VRKDPSMQAMVSALTDDDVANLAAYYAGIK
jgi:cytochrome c553